MEASVARRGYFAHSKVGGRGEPLIDHLQLTARLAKHFASSFSPIEAELAGLFHDLGKYGDLFQKRLSGMVSGVDHWSAGAWLLLLAYGPRGIAPALAVQGHHIGLQSGFAGNLSNSLNPRKLAVNHPLQLRLSEIDVDLLKSRFLADGGNMPSLPEQVSNRFVDDYRSGHCIAAMLDARMLYSALVDADFIATEAHFARVEGGAYALRPQGLKLDPETDLARLMAYLQEIRQSSKADPAVRSLRDDLMQACLEAATRPRGLYTLTAPTGSGKTLAMAAFALRHAARNALHRIIVVLPFLTLIEQTARVYDQILGGSRSSALPYVLEDHSLVETGDDSSSGYEGVQARLLAENWDSPVIVTTSVRFFESLFANRPAACRKLHNIADSVVLFDEVQTLPSDLVVPTLATLSHLQAAFGCTVVLSTATQPAFESLSERVGKYVPGGWQVQEIAPPDLKLFQRVRRIRAHWPKEGETTTLEDIAQAMLREPAAMVIVNLKRHARALYELIAARNSDGLYHLSTSMCPAHRSDILNEVKSRLANGQPCRLVATQCVEAGVDLDFPVVYRSWAPLEALAQAAGRCNREGRVAEGEYHVFLPPVDEEKYPGSSYQMAAAAVKQLLRKHGGQVDLEDPAVCGEYYRLFYEMAAVGEANREFMEHLTTLDFVGVARLYRLIKNDTVSVLVPYAARLAEYHDLCTAARLEGVTGQWFRKARPLSISIYRPRPGDNVSDWLEPVKRFEEDTGWYIYLRESHYSSALGLVESTEQEFLSA